MELIDLSHTIEHGMLTYPGLPGPEINVHMDFDGSHGIYAEGTEFSIGRISMVANTGTYLDTPAHRYRRGHDLTGLDLGRCAHLRTIVIDGAGAIDVAALEDVSGLAGAAVLFRTGWDSHWGEESYGSAGHPYLTEGCAAALIEGGVALVGIDSVNIDATETGERPIHSALLGRDIPIVEHLTGLDQLPTIGAQFFAVPPRVSGMATFPVRAFALIP